jgi:hypothetical protein
LADAEAAMQRHGDAAGSKQQRMGAGRHLVFGGGAGEAGKASFATVDHFETVA